MFKKYFILLITMLMVFSAAPALASPHLQAGELVSVSGMDDDTYAAGQTVNAADVTGDLFAAGAIVRCDSKVTQDVNMAGSVVDLYCDVGDDARLVGSIITISGIVEDDVMAFGGMIRILPDAVIKGDLILGGGSVVIDGTVNGNVLGGAGQMILGGKILGSAMVEVDDLQVSNSAKIGGLLQYTSKNDAKIDEAAVIGVGVDHKLPEVKPFMKAKERKAVSGGTIFGVWLLFFLLKTLIALVTVLAALYFLKRHIQAMTRMMLTDFPARFGWGFVWAVIIPIASIILMFTVFGSAIGAFGLVVYALTMIIAKFLAMIALGSWLWKVFSKAKSYEVNWKSAVLGVVVLNVICAIPILGWLLACILMLAALGSVSAYLKQAVK